MNPIVEGLLVVQKKVRAALLHFEKQARLPYQVGEAGAARGIFLDAVLKFSTGFLVALMTEGLKQAVAKDLRLALLISFENVGVLKESVDPVGDFAQGSALLRRAVTTRSSRMVRGGVVVIESLKTNKLNRWVPC